jgi:hypothetical protein
MTTPDAAPDMPTYRTGTAACLLATMRRLEAGPTPWPLDQIPVAIWDGERIRPLVDVRLVNGTLVFGSVAPDGMPSLLELLAPQEPAPDRIREVAGEEREPQPDEVHGVRVDAERGEQEAGGGNDRKHGRGVPEDRRGES